MGKLFLSFYSNNFHYNPFSFGKLCLLRAHDKNFKNTYRDAINKNIETDSCSTM